MTADEQKLNVNIAIEAFLAELKPGSSLEIPNVGRLEYEHGRRLSYFSFRTGLLHVWDLPDPDETSVERMIEAYLVNIYMKK
jgi:hypothetical protein